MLEMIIGGLLALAVFLAGAWCGRKIGAAGAQADPFPMFESPETMFNWLRHGDPAGKPDDAPPPIDEGEMSEPQHWSLTDNAAYVPPDPSDTEEPQRNDA